GTTLVSATSTLGTCFSTGNVVTCTLGTLPRGNSAKINLVVVPNSLGTLTTTAVAMGNEYEPDLTNNSAIVETEVLSPPSIVTQPVSQTVSGGTNVTFTVFATGSTPLAYQWFLNDTNAMPNGDSASLTLTNVTAAQAGFYTVLVANEVGRV